MNKEEYGKAIARIVAKCWMDHDFKKTFVENPALILKDEGIMVPDGMKIRVLEDTKDLRSIILPVKPEDLGQIEELEDRLAAAALPLASNSMIL